jgi:hypothetical protein
MPEVKATESQRTASSKYYQKTKIARRIEMQVYYLKNADRIKANRRERYRLSKLNNI